MNYPTREKNGKYACARTPNSKIQVGRREEGREKKKYLLAHLVLLQKRTYAGGKDPSREAPCIETLHFTYISFIVFLTFYLPSVFYSSPFNLHQCICIYWRAKARCAATAFFLPSSFSLGFKTVLSRKKAARRAAYFFSSFSPFPLASQRAYYGDPHRGNFTLIDTGNSWKRGYAKNAIARRTYAYARMRRVCKHTHTYTRARIMSST